MITRRKIIGFIMPLLLIASIFASVTPATAQPCGGDTTPDRSSFKVVDNGDGSDTATLKFRLSQTEVDALQCGMRLEIGFRFTGYETHEDETYFDTHSDTLWLVDESQEYADNDAIIQWVSIDVDELVAGKVYDLSADFGGFYAVGIDEREHLLSVVWTASEWYAEEYLGECDDNLADTVIVDDGEAYCTYSDEVVELGVHDFGY